jgi:putative flippase GtrA
MLDWIVFGLLIVLGTTNLLFVALHFVNGADWWQYFTNTIVGVVCFVIAYQKYKDGSLGG